MTTAADESPALARCKCGLELEMGHLDQVPDCACPSCGAGVNRAADSYPSRVAAPPVAPPPSASGSRRVRCVHHPIAAAVRRCELCGHTLCSTCVVRRTIDHQRVEMCPCGGRVQRLTAAERGIEPVSFQATLGTAFAYPFKGQGGVMLVLGAIFLAMSGLLFQIPIIGWGFLALTTSYMVAFLNKIIFRTTLGGDEAPEWPELARLWENVFKPFVLVCVAAAITAGPAAGIYFATGATGPIFWLLAVGGGLLLPMGIACLAVTGSALTLNPFLWLATIAKVPGDYLFACALFFTAVGMKLVGAQLAAQIPYVGLGVESLLLLYFLMVEMRILGLTLRANRTEIGWF